MRIKKISTRFLILVAVAILSLLALSSYSALMLRDSMTQDKIEKTRSIVEAARDIAKTFDERSQKGEFDQATAQSLAKTAIRGMHYDGGEYLFVYDFNGTCLVHGAKAEREGKNFLDSKDSRGYAYIPDLIKQARTGGGFVYYYFLDPKTGLDNRKVSSVVPYQPWGWMVGTGTYVTDIEQEFYSFIWKFSAISAVTLAILLLTAALVSRSITRPISALSLVTTRIAAGELTSPVPATDRVDEIGSLAQSILLLRNEAKNAEDFRREQARAKTQSDADRRTAMLSMADNFESNVKHVAEAIVSAVADTDTAAKTMKTISNQARTDAIGGAGAAQQVSANVQHVAVSAGELSDSIQAISHQVHQSAEVAERAVAKATATDRLVQGLTDAVDRIHQVVQLINDIAGQTNLLALNATIEAARAGEAGKGFAVVASEVKHLANQTAKATGDITDQIEAVKNATTGAVEAIREISDIIDQMNGTTTSIATAVAQQSAATLQISQNVSDAADGVSHVADFLNRMVALTSQVETDAETVARSSTGLYKRSDDLGSAVNEFLNSVRR